MTTPTPSFRSPRHIRPGTVVFDRDRDMVAVVRQAHGPLVTVDRPSGLTWTARYARLRPGTPREARQLRALARLHRVQQRGLPSETASSVPQDEGGRGVPGGACGI